MASPICSASFQKSYEQLQKMRSKSSAAALLSGMRRSTAAAISPLLPRKKRPNPASKVRFETREDAEDAKDVAKLLARKRRKGSKEHDGQRVAPSSGAYTNTTDELFAIMDEEDNDDPFGSYYDNVPRVVPTKVPAFAEEESDLSSVGIMDEIRQRQRNPADLESVESSELDANGN
ncbi:hypothetical protein AAVH_41605, partial [Aphelenchoides avenae]